MQNEPLLVGEVSPQVTERKPRLSGEVAAKLTERFKSEQRNLSPADAGALPEGEPNGASIARPPDTLIEKIGRKICRFFVLCFLFSLGGLIVLAHYDLIDRKLQGLGNLSYTRLIYSDKNDTIHSRSMSSIV